MEFSRIAGILESGRPVPRGAAKESGTPLAADRIPAQAWIRFWGAVRIGVLGLCLAILPVGMALGQDQYSAQPTQQPSAPVRLPESQTGFYGIDELERLFQIAKESGFGEEELRQIAIEDEQGKTVNAWDYLQEMRRRRSLKDRSSQERLQKIYLTVQDVLAELRRREKEDLKDLRDKSVFRE